MFAAHKHHGQLRVSSMEHSLPYIVHPFSVALLIAENGADDDTIIAALLHDTLEDTETTHSEIVEHFSVNVAELVESVSEVREQGGVQLTWKERKILYIENLERSGEASILIAVADKIDNIESKIESFEQYGEDILTRWKQPPEEYCWYHGEVLRIAQQRLPEHSLTKRFAEAYAKELKAFL